MGTEADNEGLSSMSEAGTLRRHVQVHSEEKSNKCNQCDYTSSRAGNLRVHLKVHSGEKSNKCNQCDYASSDPSTIRTHMKTHSGESQTNATSVTMLSTRQAI